MRLARYAFLLLVPGIPFAQRAIDRSLGEHRAQEEVLYVWSGERVKRLLPGLENLMADVYWLRTVQYFGGQRAFSTEKRFELLRPLVEITTTLDPRLEIAYRYGAIFLSEGRPVGKGDPQAGVAILEKGIRQVPSAWRLRQDLGYFRFFFLHDAKGASEVLLKAAEVPGAPYWLRTMAAAFLTKGGDRQTSRLLWRQMYEQAEQGVIKQNALWHLQYLDALDAVDHLNRLTGEFAQRVGRPPSSLDELRAAGRLRFSAVDPAGKPFAYEPATGTVSIPKDSRYWRP